MQNQPPINTQVIRFSENAEEELRHLYEELRLDQLMAAIKDGRIPSDLQQIILPATATLLDIFGKDTPAIGMDPIETLKIASRDINIARIVRERGLFRLYRMLNTNDAKTGEPMWKTLADPETGEPFRRREDLIGWFCHSARVSRSITFMRMATIEKLTGLGFSLDEAYTTILAKPTAIRETLNEVADWHKAVLEDVDPKIALRLAQKYLPPAERDEVQKLVATATDEEADPNDRHDANQGIIFHMGTAIAELVRDVAAHDDARDALEMVRIDVAGKPDIKYSWDYDRDELVCEVTIHAEDKTGMQYVKDIFTIRLVPDRAMDDGLRHDITNRLPITNRIRPE